MGAGPIEIVLYALGRKFHSASDIKGRRDYRCRPLGKHLLGGWNITDDIILVILRI